MADLLEIDELARNPVERKKHLDTIELLAAQSGVAKTEVERLYEAELERMRELARIRDYLPVLIGRKVREGLRRNHSTDRKHGG